MSATATTAKLLRNLDDFTLAYLECIFWAENDNSDDSGGDPLEDNYEFGDLDSDSLARAIDECRRFQEENAADIAAGPDSQDYTRYERAGHDFWATRQGHGAGFWDGDWPEANGERLTEACKKYGERYVYIGDNGSVYID